MASTAQIVDGKVVAETSPTYEKRSTGDSLDKQAFLQLLVAQMQYQDPLEPMDNTEYISQLAQFSALEAISAVVLPSSESTDIITCFPTRLKAF